MSVRLVLVRHGATDLSDEGRFNGWIDVPLNERGRLQAEALGEALEGTRFASVSSSDLSRASQTAVLAGFEPAIDPRLRELDFGELEGKIWNDCRPELQSALLSFDDFKAPGGESVAEMNQRLLACIGELPEGEHLVFTHGGPIRSLLRTTGEDRTVDPGSYLRFDPSSRSAI